MLIGEKATVAPAMPCLQVLVASVSRARSALVDKDQDSHIKAEILAVPAYSAGGYLVPE